jgi:hypothetical protein
MLHVNVAMLECDTSMTLEETLLRLSTLPVHLQRVGDKALAFPAQEFHIVEQALLAEEVYPTVVGPLPPSTSEPLEDS